MYPSLDTVPPTPSSNALQLLKTAGAPFLKLRFDPLRAVDGTALGKKVGKRGVPVDVDAAHVVDACSYVAFVVQNQRVGHIYVVVEVENEGGGTM